MDERRKERELELEERRKDREDYINYIYLFGYTIIIVNIVRRLV